MAERTTPRARRGLKKVLAGLAAASLLLVLFVWAVTPWAASRLLTRSVPVPLANGLATVHLRDVSVSWGGPQTIGEIEMVDAQGRTVAVLRAEAGASIAGLLLGGGDLGKVTLTGRIDAREDQLVPAARAVPVVDATATPRPSGTGGGAALPRGLRATVETRALRVSYTPAAGSGAAPVVIEGLDATASINSMTSRATLNARSASPVMEVNAAAGGFVDGAGRIDLSGAEMDLTASLNAPGEMLEALAMLALRTGDAGGAGATKAPLRISADLRARNGRVRLTDVTKPVVIEGPVPRSVVGLLAGDHTRIDLADSPVVTLTIAALDLPLPGGAGGGLDLRGGAFRAGLKTTLIEGVAHAADGSRRRFTVEPLEVEAASPDLAQVVTLKGRTRASIDGEPAASVELDAEAQGLLDEHGAVRAGIPPRLRGRLTLAGVPTVLLDPLAGDTGVRISGVLGPVVSGVVSAQTAEATGGPGSAANLPSTEVSADIGSAHFRLVASAVIDEGGLRMPGQGLFMQADRAGPAMATLLQEHGITASGAGTVIAMVQDFAAPMKAGRPDLFGATGRVRLAVGDLIIDRGIGDGPLEVRSIDNEIVLDAGKPPRLVIDHRVASGGALTRATGDLVLHGLLSDSGGAWPSVRVTPDAARPVGTVEVKGIPADLFGFTPEAYRPALREALGGVASVRIDASEGSAGATDLAISLQSEGVRAGGTVSYEDGRIRTVGEGLSAEINRPMALARAALPAGKSAAAEVLEWSQPLRISVRGLSVSLPRDGAPFDASGARGEVSLQSGGVVLSARTPEGGSERVTVDALTVGLRHTDEGASIDLDTLGRHGEARFTVEGGLALGRVLGPSGVDLSAVSPGGTIRATGLPPALIGAFMAEDAILLASALGGAADLELTAPATGTEAALGGRSLGFALRSPNLTADGSAALEEREVRTGRLTAELTLTPALVDAAAARYAPDLSPRPAMNAPARTRLTVFPTAVNLDEAGAPDMSTLRPVSVMLTSEDDIALSNLPGGPEGAALSAGVRGLVAGFRHVPADMLQSEGSIKAELFDPRDPGAPVGRVALTSSLINLPPTMDRPPPHFDLRATDVDTARMERMLARPGLLTDLLGDAAAVGLIGKPGGPGAPQQLQASVDSERVTAVLALLRSADRIDLASPASVQMTVPASWANRYLLSPGPDGAPPAASFTESTAVRATLSALTLSTAGNPLNPGVFRLDASAGAPEVRLRTQEGRAVLFAGVNASLKSKPSVRGLTFDAGASSVTIDGAGRSEPLRAIGEVVNMTDDEGTLTPDRAATTAEVTGSMPTALLDALGRQGGLLVDLLGQTTAVNARAQSLSRTGGALSVAVRTDNARADVSGRVADDRFLADDPARIVLTRITPQLSARYVETIIPIIARMEKTEQDEPGVVEAVGLTVPTNGDTRLLNGVVRADMGTVQFTTSSLFGQIVKLTGNRAAGRIGERIKPFEFIIENGVVRYEKIELPVGEFTVTTRGVVDLNEKRMDIVTFVPFYALAEELAGAIRHVPGIDRLTQVPIRTHGPFGRTRNEVKLDLIAREALPGMIKDVLPDEVKKGVGSLLEEILRKPRK